jgi:hypothetical protein
MGFCLSCRAFIKPLEGFYRREALEHFLRSMVGQDSTLKRKSIEPIALEVEGGNVRVMQRLIRDVVVVRTSCAGATTIQKGGLTEEICRFAAGFFGVGCYWSPRPVRLRLAQAMASRLVLS